MKKSIFIKIIAAILVSVFLMGLCACGEEKTEFPKLITEFPGRVNTFTFSAQPSQVLKFSEEGACSVSDVLESLKVDYPLSDMYQLDEIKKRLEFDASVQNHKFSALDASGNLTADSLHKRVTVNNEAYIKEDHLTVELPEEEYITLLCDFIVRVVDAMHQKYPDLDWDRVYCNLGNLKIIYNTGMLSYAQVSPDLVLSISKTNTGIVLSMEGEDGYSRVLIHEIMHIIQIGCVCENIENCERRAGIAVNWVDFPLNTTDWVWMVEGAAERHMCSLTGGEAVSYQYKMDYICSMTMSVLVRDSVNADTMETICFYDDPQLLFDAFGCETQEQREELINMMTTLQVLQMQPNSFFEEYKKATGVDLNADEDAMNEFCYKLKPEICISLAKEFYENLVPFLQQNELTYNDLFFLINLFEGHLNQHLSFDNSEKAEINKPFFTAYNTMRSALFEALEKDNPGLEIAALYDAYVITVDNKEVLNAELSVLPADKRDFLAERAQWQSELNALGEKVPE